MTDTELTNNYAKTPAQAGNDRTTVRVNKSSPTGTTSNPKRENR